MPIVAISGFPPKISIPQCIKILAKAIRANFDALNFGPSKKDDYKILYIKLPARLDPISCIMEINKIKFRSYKLSAFLPKTVPHLHVSKKPKAIPKKIAQKYNLKVTEQVDPKKISYLSRNDVMFEMVNRYSGLPEINKKTGNKLYGVLAKKIEERHADILSKNENANKRISMSSAYRYRYPHKSDFALIEESLQIAGGIGEPLTEDLLKPYPPADPNSIQNIPIEKVKTAISKYSTLIIDKINAHIYAMNTYTDPSKQMVEEAARTEVRTQLQKLLPYIPAMVNETIQNHFIPPKNGTLVRIYGEPKLPSRALIEGFVKKYKGSQYPSVHYYNCAHAQVPRAQAAALLAADGTVMDGCKLVIRIFTHDMIKELIVAVKDSLKGNPAMEPVTGEEQAVEPMEDESQFENEESWGNWEDI